MSKKLLKTETVMSRQNAAEKLHGIADKIADGRLELTTGNDSVTLEPADRVEFEIQVEEEMDGDMSLEVEIEWSPNDSEDIEIG
ncbi:amphi-Trp domain-containing protein [Candidatus Nanohalococcus occultus]|uniref:Amphi-Trp domain-containing protein n=1 Tax=Candidatus Nanohalococcus occultus TaxID=2978047 RepID=A0ABY8CEF5_9ARCH|nr:Uncharacterized protein SVXNc_0588 [Candidatus Nanohaloarchaeota archaeon SVXNc]